MVLESQQVGKGNYKHIIHEGEGVRDEKTRKYCMEYFDGFIADIVCSLAFC
jgi:hypothetical protein